MGRTDLARFRKNAPSLTQPVIFPSNLAWVLEHVSSHPHRSAMSAIQSLRDAASQRVQASALKLLGAHLYDSLLESDQVHSPAAQEAQSSTPELPISQIITPVLISFLFDVPDATPALVSIALQALLRCDQSRLPAFANALSTFFLCIDATRPSLSPSAAISQFDSRRHRSEAARMNALAAMLFQPQSKPWIVHRPDRLISVIRLACDLANTYVSFVEAQQNFQSSPGESGKISEVNYLLLEAACESSIKVLQDLSNFLFLHSSESQFNPQAQDISAGLQFIVDSCRRLLSSSSVPRSTSLACSITIVTAQLLLSTTDSKPATLSDAICGHFLSGIECYPRFSQLSILRAVMEAPITKPVVDILLFPSPETEESDRRTSASVFDSLVSLTMGSSDVHFRFLAMETIIGCIRRKAPLKLSEACRDNVLDLIYQRWEEPFAGITTQIREAMEALVSVDGGGEDATKFWLNLVASLVIGNWRSKGLYAPLSVLVNRVGASRILELEPNCQTLALHASANDSHLTKPVSDWLCACWKSLESECGPDAARFYQLTCKPLMDALLHTENRALRERVSENVLPAFIKFTNKQLVIQRSQALLKWLFSSQYGRACKVRGTIVIISIARKNGASLMNFSDFPLSENLRWAFRSRDEDLRASAFDLVITNSVSTTPLTDQDMEMVLNYIPVALMPGGTPSDRARFRQSMRRFFERFAGCKHCALHNNSGWWGRARNLETTDGDNHSVELLRQRYLDSSSRFERRCMRSLLSSSYPGSSFMRRTSAVEVLTLGSKNIGVGMLLETGSTRVLGNVAALLSGLVDDWERPRRATYDLISSIDARYLSLSSLSEAKPLQSRSLELLNSARQSDVDSGASLLRTIFTKHVLPSNVSSLGADLTPVDAKDMVQNLLFCNSGELPPTMKVKIEPRLKSCFAYFSSVISSLENELKEAKNDFHSSCESGLFHGRFLVLRYILQDFPWSLLQSDPQEVDAASVLRRFLNLAENCVRVAIDGVSFQKFNAMVQNGESISSADDLSPNRENETIFMNESLQLENTSCFLSAKEICVCLGVLCHQAPLDDSDDPLSRLSLNKKDMERIGSIFTFVFTSTRHWGVIDGASEGFQLLCERLLSHSSMHLRTLPQCWASDIVGSALNGQLYVLRRSAGIPWLISAIVNAEASVNRKSYDSPLLNGIMEKLLDHLECSGESVGCERDDKQGRSKSQDSIAHTLNLLRSLFLNTNIASNVMKHLERTTMFCIDAFGSSSWLIRNSAMMLYTAIVKRGIGICRQRGVEKKKSAFKASGGTSATLDGVKRLNGVTSLQFFSRHPKLQPFCYDRLHAALKNDASSTNARYELLYPILYMLSCLSPSTYGDPTASLSFEPFRSLVRNCAHWRSEYVRRAASSAFVALIDDSAQAVEIIQSIFTTDIPNEPCINSLGSVVEQNVLHGDLLVLDSILQKTVSLMSVAEKCKLLEKLCKVLPSKTWIAKIGDKNSCSVTGTVFLDVLIHVLKIAEQVDLGMERCVAEEVNVICGTVLGNLRSEQVNTCSQIGWPAFRIKSVELLGQTLMFRYKRGKLSAECAIKEIVSFLDKGDKEAMMTVLELCTHFLSLEAFEDQDENEEDVDFLQLLWRRANNIMNSDGNDEINVAVLDLLISVLCFVEKYKGSVYKKNEAGPCSKLLLELNHEVFALADVEGCVDIKEKALILFGHWVGLGTCDTVMLTKWLSLIDDACASGAASMRMAACTSLSNANMFRSGRKAYPYGREIAVNAHLTLASMLEDDNGDVQTLAMDLTQKVVGDTFASSMSEHVLPTMMNLFVYLSDKFWNSAALLRYLETVIGLSQGDEDRLLSAVEAILNVGGEALVPLASASSASENAEVISDEADEVSGRLFRMEKACGKGEPVLQMQVIGLCYARALKRCQTSHRDGSTESRRMIRNHEVSRMCEREVENLESLVSEVCAKNTGIAELLMSETFQPNGFERCMRVIVRTLLAARCALASNLKEHADFVGGRVKDLVKRRGDQIHPILSDAIASIAEGKESQLPEEAFFLLPVDELTF